MYKTIDENAEQEKYNQIADKITPEMLGLKPTNDFAQYAQQTIIDENPDKVKNWVNQGAIGVMEAGERFAFEFNGSYDKVISKEEQNAQFRKEHPLIGENRSNTVEQRIAENKRKIEERKKRINNGTASILDKIGNALDEAGKASYQAQVNYAEQQANAQMPHKGDSNYRYEPSYVDRTGRIVYNEIDLRKKIGFSEALADSVQQGKALPFVSGAIEGSAIKKVRDIENKIKNSEPIRQDELDYYNRYIDKQNEEYVRGYTISGKIGKSFLPSLLAFGGEMALGGAVLKGIGLAGKGIAGGVSLGKNLLRSGKVSKNVAKGIAYTSGQLAEGGINAAITSTVNPARLYATYQERRLNDEMKITDRGTLIFSESLESPAKSFFKSLEQIYISYFTENMGGLLASPFRAGGKAIKSVGASQFAKVMENNPALEKLIQKTSPIFSKAYEKLNNLPIKGKSVEWLKSQVKFDGFLEELGEEVLEDVLNLTAGTTNEEKTLKNYVSKIVKTPEEWAVLCGVIALQGTALSVAGNTLGDIMTNNGAEFKDTAKVLMNSTESEKIDLINEAIKNGNLKINENAIQQKQIETNRIKNKFFTQNLNAGIDEETALATATVESEAIANLAKNINMSADDVHKAFNITLQSLTDEEANEQFEKDNEELKRQLFRQDIETAGANQNEIAEAKKEWKEKGTESKYFKKWFGNSKVVDENGKPLKLSDDKDIYITDGYSNNGISRYSYKGSHRAPSYAEGDVQERIENSEDVNLEEVAQGFHNQPSDYFDTVGARYYGYDDKEGIESATAVRNIIRALKEGQKNIKITVYRAVPKDVGNTKLKNGDWITLSKSYAKAHGESNLEDNYKIISQKVPISEVWWDGNDIREWGYDNGQEQKPDLYLSIQNPKYQDKLPENWKDARKLRDEGYDGVITSDGKYLVFEKMQIKSDDNRGTFDEESPNIYFDSDLSTAFKMVYDIFSKKGSVSAEHIFKQKPMLQPLTNYFDDVLKNTRVKAMPKWMYENSKKLGSYLNLTNTIYLNIDEIRKFPNAEQNFVRVFLHELIHAKQHYLLDYAKKNQNNKKLSEDDRKSLKTFIEAFRKSKKEENEYTKFKQKYSKEEIKKNNKLLKKVFLLHNKYENAYLEIDADNVALALQSYIGNADSEILQSYLDIVLASERIPNTSRNDRYIKAIRAFIERREGTTANIRLSRLVNTNIHYQSDENSLDKTTQKNIENARGFTYERKNFDGTTKDNLIVLLKGKANKSTLLHEFAHVYLTTLNNLARENDKAKDLLIKVNKYLRYNGKEYTSYQHEKFANTFVAYVKTGKAPSYGLKRVFENFKKWLNDLYTSLQLTDDFELSKEAKDLFDELLGDMTLDAQKEASLEIIRKAKNNALLKLQQEQTDKQKIPQNQLTEKQKRYRDTAYDILWYALSHTKNEEGKQLVKDKRQLYMLLNNENQMNKKNKGIKLQAEKLEQVLAELDDPFSANDGFLPEWGEFFYDTGVSYDNQEVGADSELALMALDVIRNKKYLYDFENGYEELSENDVQVAELELDYILQVYQESGAGAKHYGAETDKSNVVVAFFEWVDNQHPYIQEELIKKWELKTNEIDRYQALSKFAQAKEDLKLYAATLKGQGDYSWQFADYARAILKRLDFMTERDKEKIFDKLKEYNSFREVERNLDFVMDYAETLSDVTDRRKLADDIVSEVKQTIHEWKDGIKKTKYTYPANKLFERLRKINNMKQEEIENLYDEQVNEETQPSYVSDEVNDKDFYETIEKMFITFKYNGLYYNSTEFLTDLLNKIQSAKFTAKVARDELDFERRLQQINLIDECARAIDVHKFEDNDTKLVELAQNLNAHIMNLNGALEMIFNNKIKNQFSLDYLYAKKDGQVGRDRREVLDKLKNIFQFKNDIQLFSRFIDMTKAEYEIKQRYTPDIENGSFHTSDIYDKESGQTKATVQQILPEGLNRNEWEPEKIKLSKMEIIYYYIQSKNNISYKMLTDMGDETTSPKGQFDKFEFDQMIDSLTMQEKLMGDVLQAAAEKYYDGLNAYHIKRYHTDLGKVSCYFPRLSEVEDPKMLDVFNDYVMYNGKDSSQKHRTAYVGTRIKPANALAVLFSHIEKANTIIIMGEQLDLMNKVFNNSNLKKKIETTFGQDVTQSFYHHIAGNLYSGQSALRSLQEQFFAKIANNGVKTQIFFKPQIGLKQLVSFMNYGKGDEYVSADEWLKEFTKQTLTPSEWKKNIDFMLENDYLRDRYSRGGSSDALKRQLESRLFSKLSLLDELWGLPIQLGDIGAIIWGGKPYVDVLMKKGYTKEQAFKIFIETTVNDQQSSIPSTLSNAQREAKKNAFATMMFAYQNTPHQYLRSCYTPIVKALQTGKKEDILKAAKMLFIYGWLFPAIFNMASTLSVFSLLGGDDDQFKKDMQFAFLGLFGMLPIWGDALKAIVYGLFGDRYAKGDYFNTSFVKMNKLTRDIAKEKVTLADVWNAIAVIGEMSTGQPLGSMGNAVSGIYDVTQGNAAKGALKVMGYSDYRAKTVTGEK